MVSRASRAAIDAVEAAGGTVTCQHYNRFALRGMLPTSKWDDDGTPAPRQAQPPPKWQPYHTRWENRGHLHPAVQVRNWLRRHEKTELVQKLKGLLEKQQQQQSEQEQ